MSDPLLFNDSILFDGLYDIFPAPLEEEEAADIFVPFAPWIPTVFAFLIGLAFFFVVWIVIFRAQTAAMVNNSLRRLSASFFVPDANNNNNHASNNNNIRTMSAQQRPRSNTATTFSSHVSNYKKYGGGSIKSTASNKSAIQQPPHPLDDDEDEYNMAWMHDESPFRQYAYYGPNRYAIRYETWTPPVSWQEASRHLLPLVNRLPLQREIDLCLGPTMTIRIHAPGINVASHTTTTSSDTAAATTSATTASFSQEPAFELPIHDMAPHVQNDAGGVLTLYIKDSVEQMEHTFVTAAEAAQFQIDMIGLQLLGSDIYNMYQALQLINRGSLACEAHEVVVHDSHLTVDAKVAGDMGIAWDDVMRCLGSSFPSIRLKLEAVWWLQATDSQPAAPTAKQRKTAAKRKNATTTPTVAPASTTATTDANTGSHETSVDQFLKEDYVKKRLLLGSIDFFRLFVPALPQSALPKTSASKARVEQLMRWSKRVARASQLVKAYTEARIVVNRGWVLDRPLPDKYWKRRLAFDDNLDNVRWDEATETEYYEPTVSRDIVCQVRGLDSLSHERRKWWRFGFDGYHPTLSQTQGYTLVGLHTFRIPPNASEDFPLSPGSDPVLALPSLRALIEDNPDRHFFVTAYIPDQFQACIVSVFVRALPIGIDAAFDTAVEKFVNGDEAYRDQKLELILQLGIQQEGQTWSNWFLILLLSFLARFSFLGDSPPQQSTAGSDRVCIPALRLATCGETHHFGGALNELRKGRPTNYIAHSIHTQSRHIRSLAMKVFIGYVAKGGLRRDVLDFTFVIAGGKEDELPERALACVRYVHPRVMDAVVSPSFLIPARNTSMDDFSVANQDGPYQPESSASLYLRLFVTDPLVATMTPLARALAPSPRRPSDAVLSLEKEEKAALNESYARVMSTTDALEEAVNEVVRILDTVDIPVRKEQLVPTKSKLLSLEEQTGLSIELPNDSANAVVKVPILSRVSRDDILRYFIGAACSHKSTVVRLVDSASWHGVTFPLDTAVCRIELQNGQFFGQGHDKEGHPVFYFRNMCLGPWRRDENAVITAVLHRLERAVSKLSAKDPRVKCTLVVLLGKPFRKKAKKDDDEDMVVEEEGHNGGEQHEVSVGADHEQEAEHDGDDKSMGVTDNPRIDPTEQYYVHTSKRVVRRLISLVMQHYPERLHKAYVVVGYGNKTYTRTAVGGTMRLSKYILHSQRTREKVKFLIRYNDLREYISSDQLVTIAGGDARIHGDVFECKWHSL